MAYIQINSKVNGDPITASDWNQIVNNFAAGIPGALTEKGDMLSATEADNAVVIPVGSDYSVLMADSSETPGLKWGYFASRGGAAVKYEGATTSIFLQDITWKELVFNTTAMFDTSGNMIIDQYGNTYYSIPADEGGYYYIGMQVALKPTTNQWNFNEIKIAFSIDGSIESILASHELGGASATTETFGEFMLNGSDIVYIEGDSYVEFWAWADFNSSNYWYLSAEVNPIRAFIIRLE